LITSYTEEFPDVIIIHMTGLMARDSLKEIEEAWDEQLKKRPEILALNLKGVVGVDSITMNHIFNLCKKASSLDVKLIICDASEELKAIFDIVRLERIIPLMDDKKFRQDYVVKNWSPR